MGDYLEKKKVLLVEDELIIGLSTKSELENYGYEVKLVTNGKEVLDIILKENVFFDIILMDIDLGGGLDGTQVAQEILKEKDIPVVFLSSHSEPEIVEKTEKITSYGYVLKSSSLVVLDASIKMALRLFKEKSERRKVEDKNAVISAYYESIFESAGVAMLVVDDEGTIVSANGECKNATGYTPEELIGTKWYLYVDKDYIDIVKNYNEQMFIGQKKVSDKYEVKLINKNGEKRNVILSVGIVRNEKRTIVALHDVTELRKTMDELKESKRRIETLMDNLPGMAYRCKNDRNWTMEFVSSGCFELTGYKPEELLFNNKISYNDLIKPEDREWIWNGWQEKLKSREKFTLEYEIICKDGNTKWVWEQGQGVYTENGELEAIEGFIVDIIGIKKVENGLISSQQYIKAILDSMNDALFVDDADTGEIIDVNERCCEMYGYTYEEMVNIPIGDLSLGESPYSQKEAIEWLKKTREEGPQVFSWCAKRKDGSLFWVEVSTRFVIIDGKNRFVVIVRDITERKEKEEQFKSLFYDSASVMLLINPEDGSIVDANNAAIKFYGYNREKLVSMKITDINILPIEKVKAEMERAKKQERNYFLFEHRLADGTIKSVEVYSGPIVRGGKKLLYSIIHDITERNIIYNELKTNKDKLNLLLELAPDAFLHGDKDGNIIGVNHKACEMFGYSREEFLSLNIKALFKPEEFKSNPLSYELLKKGKIVIKERKAIKKNGEEIFIEMNSRMMPDGTYQSFIRDITYRKKMEMDLKESEERYRVLVEASFGGIAIHDQGVILESNIGLSEMTGYSLDELIGMNGLLLISEKCRADVINKIQTGYEKPYESIGVRKNGEEFPLLIQGRNLYYKGKKVRATEFRDLTDIKRVEQQIKKELEEKEILLREVHHRIKNHMANVISLLSMQINATSNEETKMELENAISMVRGFHILYEKLLLTKGYQEISFKAYLDDLIDSIVSVQHRNKLIIIEVNKDIDDFVISSKKTIDVGIIVTEILTNVFKYAFQGKGEGKIFISVKKIDNNVNLKIIDNGVGLENKKDSTSTGLGLRIVNILAKQLNGSFNITSTEKGTTSILNFSLEE